MQRIVAVGFATALSITGVGCDTDDGLERGESLELSALRATYPYDPELAGPKGSGDLGQSETSLEIGQHIIADCVNRPESDAENSGITDSVRVEEGEFEGWLIPLQVYVATESGLSDDAVHVFDHAPEDIRERLEFC